MGFMYMYRIRNEQKKIYIKIKYNTRENILLSEVANFSQALMSVV